MRGITALSCIVLTSFSLTTAQESLRKYADAMGLDIGVAIRESYITSSGSTSITHNDIVKTQFNTVVCENAMKSQAIAPSKTSYAFTTADKVLDFAVANRMKIRGHTLFWYFQNASWLSTGPRDTLLANMKYHIQQLMGHYKGKVFQWDVVNEAFAEDGAYRTANNPYQTIIGEDYIDSAFVWAHAADPAARLYINEFTTTFPGPKADALYNKVKTMLANGIPIHGVGFQCHEAAIKDLAAAGVAEGFKYSLDRFAGLGVELAVTELDLESADFAVQAANYATYLRVVLSVPQCRTFMMWGVSDRDSWHSSGTPLIYDRDFKAKPAYDSLLAVLVKTQVESFPEIRRMRDAYLQGEMLKYDQLAGTLSLGGANGASSRLELFDLRGMRIAVVTLPSNAAFLLSSIIRADGPMVVKSGNALLQIGGVRR